MKKLIVLALVTLIAAAIGSCGVITGAGPAPSTTATATTTGRELFYYQSERGELGAALEENEKETFAGCWIDGAKLVAVFTRDSRDIIDKYVEKGSPLDKVIELRTFPVTLEELKNAQREAAELLDSLDLLNGSSIDVKENIVEVYATDKELFDTTLAEAGAVLPDHVRVVVNYEPLGEPPFEVNPPEGVHFPQLRMRSSMFMQALLTGTLELRDGYLYVGDALIIWQADYFLTERDGAIEVLDRDGEVVGRVGEEITMGGGGIDGSYINSSLKEPLPEDFTPPCFLQGSETSLGSDLFHLQVLEQGGESMYFLTQQPSLLDIPDTREWPVATCEFTATYKEELLEIPRYEIDRGSGGSEKNTVLWPEDYRARIVNGVVEIADDSGVTVVRNGEKVFLKGKMINPKNSELAVRLASELPDGMDVDYFLVADTIPWQPDPEIITTSLEMDGITVNITAPADLFFSDLKLEPGVCEKNYFSVANSESYQAGDPCLLLTGTVRNMSPNRSEIAITATGMDPAGQRVAYTLDLPKLAGMLQLRVFQGESEMFILHLSPSDEVAHLEIGAGTGSYPAP